MVNVNSDYYKIAYAYMLRLKKADFMDPFTLAKLAAVVNLNQDKFKNTFEYLVKKDNQFTRDVGQEILKYDKQHEN